MTLLENIKSDLTEARKAKDSIASGILSTLFAESTMVGKNDGNRKTTDAEVFTKVKAFLKNIEETRKCLPEGHTKFHELDREKELLAKYMPRKMSEEELKAVIESIGAKHENSMKSMGKIMAELKAKHDGEYDGKSASNMVKVFLSR